MPLTGPHRVYDRRRADSVRDVPSAAAVLVGGALTEETITAAAETAMSATKPMDALDLPLGYRRRMVMVHVARALRELALGCR